MTMLEQDIMDAVGEAYRAMADQAERRGFKVRWISMPYGKIPYWPVATIPTDQFAAHSISTDHLVAGTIVVGGPRGV